MEEVVVASYGKELARRRSPHTDQPPAELIRADVGPLRSTRGDHLTGLTHDDNDARAAPPNGLDVRHRNQVVAPLLDRSRVHERFARARRVAAGQDGDAEGEGDQPDRETDGRDRAA